MTQKQSVKQTVKVVIGDSVLLKAGRRKKAVRRKKQVKAPVPTPAPAPAPPARPSYGMSMFGNQLFAQPPQFLRAELPAVKVAQPAVPTVQQAVQTTTPQMVARQAQTETPTPQLTRKATEPISFVEKKGTPIPEPVRSFITKASMSLADLIRRESSASPVPVIKVPSVRDLNLDSKDPEPAPNQANQPSVDVSRPDPRPPAPQVPSGAPLVAAQPAYVGQPAYSPAVFSISASQEEEAGEDVVLKKFPALGKPELGVPGGKSLMEVESEARQRARLENPSPKKSGSEVEEKPLDIDAFMASFRKPKGQVKKASVNLEELLK